MVSVLWLLNSAIGARLAIREDLLAEWVAGLYVGRNAPRGLLRGWWFGAVAWTTHDGR
jgi:hypothetical protein